MPVGIAHAKVGTAVAYERMPHELGFLLNSTHVAHIEAEVDVAWVAPVTVFVEFLAWRIDALDEFQMRGSHDTAQRAFDGFRTFKDDTTQSALTAWKTFQVVENACLVKDHLVVVQKLRVEGKGAIDVAHPNDGTISTARDFLLVYEDIVGASFFTAAPKAAIMGTLSVPERMPFSCLPPVTTGSTRTPFLM